MRTMKLGTSPVTQLQAGLSILAAARTVDTRPIKARLMAFERAQNELNAAHAQVTAAEAQLAAAQTALDGLDADQDQHVDAMARALIADGLSRTNPFGVFGSAAPGALIALPVADEAQAIHQLVIAIQRHKPLAEASVQAAHNLDNAARAVEEGLAHIETLQAALREARHTREAVAQRWTRAAAALKRGARAAADDGAPQLYGMLFERPRKPNGKAAKPAPAPQPAEPPANPAS